MLNGKIVLDEKKKQQNFLLSIYIMEDIEYQIFFIEIKK